MRKPRGAEAYIPEPLPLPEMQAMNAVDRAFSGASLRTLLERLPALAASIAEGASQREREGTLPFEAFALLRASGLGALRIPADRGGPGGSIEDLVQVVATLAAADSNVAHALRTHYNAIELWTSAPPNADSDRQLARVLEGALFGGAFTELGTPRSGTVTTALERQGDRIVLNGSKYYATGTAFSDFASIAVRDEEGRDATVIVPTARAGLHVKDDWDGMGQRLTASGSLEFEDLEVRPDEIVLTSPRSLQRRHASVAAWLHIHQHDVDAGVGEHFQRIDARGRHMHCEAVRAKDRGDRARRDQIAVEHENLRLGRRSRNGSRSAGLSSLRHAATLLSPPSPAQCASRL